MCHVLETKVLETKVLETKVLETRALEARVTEAQAIKARAMQYSELHSNTNFSFLKGASHPREMVARAKELGYRALAITDECSLAGIVKAHIAARDHPIKLIIGSEFTLTNQCRIVALAPNKTAYSELSGFITLARRRALKGEYEAHMEDLRFRLQHCLIIWLPPIGSDDINKQSEKHAKQLIRAFKDRVWLGVSHQLCAGEQQQFPFFNSIAQRYHIPLVACGSALMHSRSRKGLQDTLTAIRHNTSVSELGTKLTSNAEAYLKPINEIEQLYPPALIQETLNIAERCTFSMEELRYQYPRELVPEEHSPISYLKELVNQGKEKRWPDGVPQEVEKLLDKELSLIEELHYEYYFLTVFDIVAFAKKEKILCQGRGSAANSVVCYCLGITEIKPGKINVLFERFISKERDEPPDIDVDFENQRREEVIQYIYQKYGRERSAIAATVITYRARSAIRDVGKALGLEQGLIDHIAKSLAWWDRTAELLKHIEKAGLQPEKRLIQQFFMLVQQILGFPRHLSQHVGGFVITEDSVSHLVPLENASMPDRTIIQWDKEDLEAMNLLKVDVLALGMLTALRKSMEYIKQYRPGIDNIRDIPDEDPATYSMLQKGDSIGVFQVESRAQMSMLPRLKPSCFYDLVIEIAIVRPGPIQGDMVHPYLRRRDGLEAVTYHNDKLKNVLEKTLGIPIFQEQAIRLAMVAAGFSGGEADQLRRAMASWGKNGNLLQFEKKFIDGMLNNGYPLEYAERLFEQIKGFGGYGFPESHSASFALLCYASSWFKCHHPAAFYCALLNSQPMGFYSPSQLVQDARRHDVHVLPIDINQSIYDCRIEKINNNSNNNTDKNSDKNIDNNAKNWGIRLGFSRIKELDTQVAESIENIRGEAPFTSIEDLAYRGNISQSQLQVLASSDALREIGGNRYLARWNASAIKPKNALLHDNEDLQDELFTAPPTIEQDVTSDYQMSGLSLRPHFMVFLRQEKPFCYCKKQSELSDMHNGSFVRVAGLVTGRQRPGTAKGTIFVTLEDETGNINIVIWPATQKMFRNELLTSKLLLVKGRLETKDSVIHIIAGQLHDYSDRLEKVKIRSRDFH